MRHRARAPDRERSWSPRAEEGSVNGFATLLPGRPGGAGREAVKRRPVGSGACSVVCTASQARGLSFQTTCCGAGLGDPRGRCWLKDQGWAPLPSSVCNVENNIPYFRKHRPPTTRKAGEQRAFEGLDVGRRGEGILNQLDHKRFCLDRCSSGGTLPVVASAPSGAVWSSQGCWWSSWGKGRLPPSGITSTLPKSCIRCYKVDQQNQDIGVHVTPESLGLRRRYFSVFVHFKGRQVLGISTVCHLMPF
ncbi:hypothetical protein TREES_T100015680 [Tupaia chinensis]|uniref:Uncharacterized protein n=1 Tax=Tupaia chinensis TaxID=246437 RepID=L9L8F5_TUPCH|nr:hypothetical protein TREES_T100015680 [Tupaia chinensis]